MKDNLASKVEELIDEKIRKELRERKVKRRAEKFQQRKEETQDAWERNKESVFQTFRFLGATTLLAGTLFLGSRIINNLPESDYSNKINQQENQIEELQKDKEFYTANIEKNRTFNEKLRTETATLSKQVAIEKKRRNIFGKVKSAYKKEQVTKTEDKEETNKNSEKPTNKSPIRNEEHEKKNNQQTVTQKVKEEENQRKTQYEQTTKEPDKPVTYQLKLSGNNTEQANIVAWLNGEEFTPTNSTTTNYFFSWKSKQPSIRLDSLVGTHKNFNGYERFVKRDVLVSENTKLDVMLTKKNVGGRLGYAYDMNEFKYRNNKIIIPKDNYALKKPLVIDEGKTLIIRAGTKILGHKNFEIILNGGNLEIKGSTEDPVRFVGTESTWEGITFINSHDNKIRHCIIAEVKDTDSTDGGAITAYNSSIELDNVHIIKTYSSQNGGSILVENSTLTLKNGRLAGGEAKNKGGNIYAVNSKLDIIDSEVFNGTAEEGGNIYILNHEGTNQEGLLNYPLFIQRSKISYGVAEKGGGIFLDQALMEMQQTITSTNRATYGGGIYGKSCLLNIVKNSSVLKNEATIAGGGGYFVKTTIQEDKIRKVFTENSPNNLITK